MPAKADISLPKRVQIHQDIHSFTIIAKSTGIVKTEKQRTNVKKDAAEPPFFRDSAASYFLIMLFSQNVLLKGEKLSFDGNVFLLFHCWFRFFLRNKQFQNAMFKLSLNTVSYTHLSLLFELEVIWKSKVIVPKQLFWPVMVTVAVPTFLLLLQVTLYSCPSRCV